jgi:hypothetical protein
MNSDSGYRVRKAIFRILPLLLVAASLLAAQANPAAAAPSVVKQLGSIRKLSGSDLSLETDQGATVVVHVQPGARLLRLAPGQMDLKSAAVIQLLDLQEGDRVRVRGKLAADGSIEAAEVIVMKQQDIAQQKQQELADWQRRGVGGLVKQVVAETGSITLTVNARTVMVNTTPKTSYKRYAPDSARWEDATAAKLADIHPGDQLRAKGNKSEDGSQITAEEIVAGTFPYVQGLITSVDPAQGTVTVKDVVMKKPVTILITTDSQMKKLPPQVAQGIAMRLKGGSPPAPPANASESASGRPRGDLNQLLGRLPAVTLADLKKGEAVMILSTQGSASKPPVALTVLGGVEPILTASPAGAGAQSFLTPWSLASAPPGADQ